jgi:membrane-anchored glycerophosphoryl diester phosphodiesterase (GDPDase)
VNYGELLSEAFRLTWRNRFLWFFGLFVAGAGGSFNFPTNLGGGQMQAPFGSPAGPLRWISENLALFVAAVIAVVVVLALVFLVLAMISHGALVESVAALHRGEARRFGPAFRTGARNFWRVLGLKVLFFLMALGLGLLVFLPVALGGLTVFSLTDSTGVRVLAVVLGVLFVVVALVVVFLPFAIINQFALRELVVSRRRILESTAGGFGLFRRNIGRSLLAWLVQLAVMLGLGIATVVVLVILGAIFLGPAIALFATERATAGVVAAVIGGLLFLVPLLVISGALGAFNHAYWTLAYLRLTEHPEGSQPGQASAAA